MDISYSLACLWITPVCQCRQRNGRVTEILGVITLLTQQRTSCRPTLCLAMLYRSSNQYDLYMYSYNRLDYHRDMQGYDQHAMTLRI